MHIPFRDIITSSPLITVCSSSGFHVLGCKLLTGLMAPVITMALIHPLDPSILCKAYRLTPVASLKNNHANNLGYMSETYFFPKHLAYPLPSITRPHNWAVDSHGIAKDPRRMSSLT